MTTQVQKLRREDLLYPGLSYEIIGSAFDVYNAIGSGHKERVYEKALAESFSSKKIHFKEQLSVGIIFQGKTIGRRFLDFLVENKIVVEIKQGSRFAKTHIDQVVEYLRTNNLRLALLINFGTEGVQFKRLVNIEKNS